MQGSGEDSMSALICTKSSHPTPTHLLVCLPFCPCTILWWSLIWAHTGSSLMEGPTHAHLVRSPAQGATCTHPDVCAIQQYGLVQKPHSEDQAVSPTAKMVGKQKNNAPCYMFKSRCTSTSLSKRPGKLACKQCDLCVHVCAHVCVNALCVLGVDVQQQGVILKVQF